MQEKEQKKKAKEKNQLGLTADQGDFGEWFSELMIKTDLADYTEVSGCIVFKPSSYEIWESIKQLIDLELKKFGVRNCYFPLFIPEKYLNKEKRHVEGFSPEVAWVTHAGDKELSERLAIRPTSETIMYPSYSKWIRSWRDLPLKLNQWNNVIRWEFSHPIPFFRTREFLWNELHTALATEKEALEEGKEIINSYDKVCRDYLALYGIIGKKTEREKFAGGVASTKIHYILPSGRVIEGPCFHYDGQNFARAYDIRFLDKDGKDKYVHQNTYAISTRMLGTMFAIHADKTGLIIPPRIATNEIVIIPIFNDKNKKHILSETEKIYEILKNYSPILDSREDQRPGFKFNEYELKGMPLRIEIGPKDLEKKEVTVVRRDTLKKQQIKIAELGRDIPIILEEIQKNLFNKSKELFISKIEKTNSLESLKKIIENKKVGIIPLCKKEKCEETLKFQTKGAKAVFISEKDIIKNDRCIICNKKADYFVYAGKSY